MRQGWANSKETVASREDRNGKSESFWMRDERRKVCGEAYEERGASRGCPVRNAWVEGAKQEKTCYGNATPRENCLTFGMVSFKM